MKAIFLNDCSGFHVGSWAVTHNLRRLAGEVGIELVPYRPEHRPEPGQLVILNGEGTMHHNAPHALWLHDRCVSLKSEGCRIVMLNSVLQALDVDYSIYERIATRETLSGDFAKTKFSGPVDVLPDLAFCTPPPPQPESQRQGVLFIDGTCPRFTAVIEGMAGRLGEKMLRMCEYKGSPSSFISLLQQKEAVVTGRFHGAVFAIMAGTPFLAVPSNTWKTQGLLRDFRMESNYHQDENSLRQAFENRQWVSANPESVATIAHRWKSYLASLFGHYDCKIAEIPAVE